MPFLGATRNLLTIPTAHKNENPGGLKQLTRFFYTDKIEISRAISLSVL